MVWSSLFIIILAILVAGILYMYGQAERIHLRREVISSPDWPQGFDGVTFLWITDLHRQVIPTNIIEILQQTKIDLVLLGGDITEQGVPMARVRQNIQLLAALAPTYFVWGNHDYEVDYRELERLLLDEGVHILDNRAASFEAGNDRLWLIGVDDVSRDRDKLHFALQDIESLGYRLLLAHDPKIIRKIKKEDGIHMVWCGHTHGGQILFPFISSLVVGPFYRKYLAGFYKIKEKGLTLFISKGVGTSHLPLRFGAQPEMHLFTLRSKKDSIT